MGRVSGGPGPDSMHVEAAVWGVPTPAVGLWGDALASDREREGENLLGAAVHMLRRYASGTCCECDDVRRGRQGLEVSCSSVSVEQGRSVGPGRGEQG